METQTPTQTRTQDPTLHLPRDTYWLVVDTLRRRMPTPPPDYTPEDIDRRTRAAIAEVASILPSNAEEATLAAQYVGAKFYALDCLSLAGESRADISCYLKCMAQAARTSREERGLRLLLQRLQAERRTREADSGATDRAAWTEYCAVGLMAEALGWKPPPAMPEPPPPAAAPPQPEAPDSDEPVVDLVAEADMYAVIHPRRAARIRALGGLPEPCDFGPPEPELVHAIVTGTSSTLRALDKESVA
jgi:hypothetical protein